MRPQQGQRARDGERGAGPLQSRLSGPRLLIIGPSNIGDAILTGDVIADVRRQFPDAHLTLVVGQRAASLFREDPGVHSLVETDAFRGAAGRLRLALALWRYQPQIVVDLRHTLYPLLLKPLAFWRYLRQPPRTLVHMRERHLWKLHTQVLAGEHPTATTRVVSTRDVLWVSPKDRAQVESLWRRWQLEGYHGPVVVICPGARSHIKRWTAAGFAWVADRLADECGAQVILCGEPDEEAVVEEIVGLMSRAAHSAVGLTTIRQLGILMQRAHLVITNDSASLHLASAVGTPTVAIFGPTDERKYGPTAPQHRVIRRRLFCTPCEQALCRFSHECMRFISPDDVLTAAKQLLEQGTGDRGQEKARTR